MREKHFSVLLSKQELIKSVSWEYESSGEAWVRMRLTVKMEKQN